MKLRKIISICYGGHGKELKIVLFNTWYWWIPLPHCLWQYSDLEYFENLTVNIADRKRVEAELEALNK